MRVAHVARPKGPLEVLEREIPEPGAEQVRIKIEACGVCHSDAMTRKACDLASSIHVCQGTRSPESSRAWARA
jgi:D-arabinose 1-dehydrogenase-like Zn-dependent alcohol dehydrogenase